MTWNISCQSLLDCKVSFDKSADSLMGTPLQVTDFFSLAALKILSLSLTFGIFIMMCLGVGPLHPSCLGLSVLPGLSFTKSRKFSFTIFFRFPISCSFSSHSGTHMIRKLERLKLSWRLLNYPHFWGFFFLAAFKILSLSLAFGVLIMMCIGVGLFASILFGTLCFLDLHVYFLHQIREVFVYYFSNRFPISCSFSSPSGTPMI